MDYIQDKSSQIRNTITTQGQLTNGLNIVNIAKLLAKVVSANKDQEKRTLLPSKVLPLIFEQDFFTEDLALKIDEVDGFFEELDQTLPSDRLLKKDMEFQLIEYLFQESEKYKKKSGEKEVPFAECAFVFRAFKLKRSKI